MFVRLQPYKHISLKNEGKNKLAPKFYGPYHITKNISQVAYELHLLDKIHIHNVFHVSCLKKMLGQHQTVHTILPMLHDKGRIIWEPKEIIATIERRRCFRTLKEYLIRWKNFPDEDASWEIEQFHQQYPSLPLL